MPARTKPAKPAGRRTAAAGNPTPSDTSAGTTDGTPPNTRGVVAVRVGQLVKLFGPDTVVRVSRASLLDARVRAETARIAAGLDLELAGDADAG